MRTFTVLGVYEDSGQTFAGYYPGKDQYEAIANAAKDTGYSSTLIIIGAIPGVKKLLTPGEDNIISAYASNYDED